MSRTTRCSESLEIYRITLILTGYFRTCWVFPWHSGALWWADAQPVVIRKFNGHSGSPRTYKNFERNFMTMWRHPKKSGCYEIAQALRITRRLLKLPGLSSSQRVTANTRENMGHIWRQNWRLNRSTTSWWIDHTTENLSTLRTIERHPEPTEYCQVHEEKEEHDEALWHTGGTLDYEPVFMTTESTKDLQDFLMTTANYHDKQGTCHNQLASSSLRRCPRLSGKWQYWQESLLNSMRNWEGAECYHNWQGTRNNHNFLRKMRIY